MCTQDLSIHISGFQCVQVRTAPCRRLGQCAEIPLVLQPTAQLAFSLLKKKHWGYYFASDASAVMEHINHVIFLEDDYVAEVVDGYLSIH